MKHLDHFVFSLVNPLLQLMAIQPWANDLEIHDFLDDLLFDGRDTYSAAARAAILADKSSTKPDQTQRHVDAKSMESVSGRTTAVPASSSSSSFADPGATRLPAVVRPQPYGPKPGTEAGKASVMHASRRRTACSPDAGHMVSKHPISENNFGVVVFRIAEFTQAGKVLKHCIGLIDSVLALYPGCVVFKIGVTTDPVRRYFDKSIGYAKDKDFEKMLVLCRTHTAEGIGFLEAALIMKYGMVPGCRNVGPGGENVQSGSAELNAFYSYVVYRVLPRP